MAHLRIGELARQAGLSVETLRYYERRGLIPPPARLASGYRIYPEETLDRLTFIRRGKTLGFSLEEIAELLQLEVNPQQSAGPGQDPGGCTHRRRGGENTAAATTEAVAAAALLPLLR